MIDKLNNLIDLNLRFLLTEHNFSSFHLLDLDNKSFNKNDHLQLANFMYKKGLVTINGQNCTLTEEGLLIAKNGGWLKHLDDLAKLEAERQAKVDSREQLETNLAISNMEANKLNAKIAEQNRKDHRLNKIFLIINAVFAIINISIAILQLMKPAK